VSHRPLCGQNVNFVCGLVDKSLDVQINAIRIKFVKYKHKYRNQHVVLHKLYTWSLEETWSRVSGDEVGLFCRPLQNVKFRGTAGTHCLGEFQYLNQGFRVGLYIGLVDFVDFSVIFSRTVRGSCLLQNLFPDLVSHFCH